MDIFEYYDQNEKYVDQYFKNCDEQEGKRMAEKKVSKLVRLAELDLEIVNEEAAVFDTDFSDALRKIIREWARTRRPMPVETETATAV